MKKGESFKLEYRWWDKGRPVALKSTGLGKALQAYEKNESDAVLALDALAAVDAARKKAITMCGNTLFPDTKAALQRADALDFAAKVHQKRVLGKGAVFDLTDATESLKHYVPHLSQKLADYDGEADPRKHKALATEIGVNAQYVRDYISRANTATKSMLDHETALKQYQSLWASFTAAKRNYDKVAPQARDVLTKVRNFAGGH